MRNLRFAHKQENHSRRIVYDKLMVMNTFTNECRLLFLNAYPYRLFFFVIEDGSNIIYKQYMYVHATVLSLLCPTYFVDITRLLVQRMDQSQSQVHIIHVYSETPYKIQNLYHYFVTLCNFSDCNGNIF